MHEGEDAETEIDLAFSSGNGADSTSVGRSESGTESADIVVELNFPALAEGGDRDKLMSETHSDPSLKPWRGLAEKKEKGLEWRDEK